MALSISITKSDFTEALPVGTSASDKVFAKVEPYIKSIMILSETEILGDAGVQMIEDAGGESVLAARYRRFIVLAATVALFRQLDLVLTPTGFGVVSNDNLAPASQARVDALNKQLALSYERARALLIHNLRSPEWGVQTVAADQIETLYGPYEFFFGAFSSVATMEKWEQVQPIIERCDSDIRNLISHEQMEALLTVYRCKDTSQSVYVTFFNKYRRFVEASLVGNVPSAAQIRRKLFLLAESDATLFAPYFASSEYQANHHENFQNSKKSSGFLFNG